MAIPRDFFVASDLQVPHFGIQGFHLAFSCWAYSQCAFSIPSNLIMIVSSFLAMDSNISWDWLGVSAYKGDDLSLNSGMYLLRYYSLKAGMDLFYMGRDGYGRCPVLIACDGDNPLPLHWY